MEIYKLATWKFCYAMSLLKQKTKTNASTQRFLDIAEIKEDTVILRDGSMRTVLLVSSVNFALKSEDEQNAIISGYISFLNSLTFPLQIVVQSRRLNLDAYLSNLEQKRKEQANELLKVQMADYIGFVRELIQIGEIMTKRFYVIVPFDMVAYKKRQGFIAGVKRVLAPGGIIKLDRKRFAEYKDLLDKRTGYVASGLGSTGLRTARLNTQALIELYYESYNPVMATTEKLPEIEKLQMETT